MSEQDDKFPVTNKQAAVEINGVHTEILITEFTDRLLIVITQYGKIGSLVSVFFMTCSLFLTSI